MKFYFLRHARSVGNVRDDAGKRRGGGEDQLSEAGRQEARRAGQQLLGDHFTKLIAGPMQRTKQTAELLSKALKLPVEIHPENYNPFQSKKYYRAKPADRRPYALISWMSAHNDDPDYTLDGSESFNQVLRRVKHLQRYLLKQPKDEKPLVVTHGNLMRFWLGLSMFGNDFQPKHLPYLRRVRGISLGLSIFEYKTKLRLEGQDFSGWRLYTWMRELDEHPGH